MSTFTHKSKLIGGGDVTAVASPSVYSYQEARVVYPELPNKSLTLRVFHRDAPLGDPGLTATVVFQDTQVSGITADINGMFADVETSAIVRADIDDARLRISIVHPDYTRLDVLAHNIAEGDASDAINVLGLHPHPHPAGTSSRGDIALGMSNRANRALSAGAFLVRNEDRTSTGINRALSVLSTNADHIETSLRDALHTDVVRDLHCSMTPGGLGNVYAEPLLGGELLGKTLTPQAMLVADAFPDMLVELSTKAREQSYVPQAIGQVPWVINVEAPDGGYDFGEAYGRTSPEFRPEYTYIALTEAAAEAARQALGQVSRPALSSSARIDSEDYWGSADYIGTIYGPQYSTQNSEGSYVAARVIDYYTLRFEERLPHLHLVRQGDTLICDGGVFAVDFVGDDRRTVGVTPFAGSIAHVFNATDESFADVPRMDALVPGQVSLVALIKSAYGAPGEFYGVGRRGYSTEASTEVRKFRIRTRAPKTYSTSPTDDLSPSHARLLQEVVDPYTGLANESSIKSLRGLYATGGMLRIPRVYDVPSDLETLPALDYMLGSHNFGPLRVGPTSYQMYVDDRSIFMGVGGSAEPPNADMLAYMRDVYKVALLSLESSAHRELVARGVDELAIHGDLARGVRMTDMCLAAQTSTIYDFTLFATRSLSEDERARHAQFLRDIVQASGRSLVTNNTDVTINVHDGLTLRLSTGAEFSEDDVGRVFILRLQGKDIRVRLHTWTSPMSARFIPLEDIPVEVTGPVVSGTLSMTLGYGNIGYGAFTNSVIPRFAPIYGEDYPVDRLTMATAYTHTVPGSVTSMNLHAAHSTSLRAYTQLFTEATTDCLIAETSAYAIFVQKADQPTNEPIGGLTNHVTLPSITDLIYSPFPFLRSDTEELTTTTKDILNYVFSSSPEIELKVYVAYTDLPERVSSASVDELRANQNLLFILNSQASLINANDGEPVAISATSLGLILAPILYPYVRPDDIRTQFDTEAQFFSAFDQGAVVHLRRAAGRIRPEDAQIHRDVRALLPSGDSNALNVEDLLIHELSDATAELGHARQLGASGTTETSNYALYFTGSDGYGQSLVDAYNNSPTPAYIEQHVATITLPNSPSASARRSWFTLHVTNLSGTSVQHNFTFDWFGKLVNAEEYYASARSVPSSYGAFVSFSANGPTYENTITTLAGSATCLVEDIGPSYTALIKTLHGVLYADDLPYAPTIRVSTRGHVAPVSKELARTLSAGVGEGASIISNMVPTTVKHRAGAVDKIAYDMFSNTGAEVTIYNSAPSSLEGYREDAIKVDALTRGYTDAFPPNMVNFGYSRRKSAVHIAAEETTSATKVSHRGIDTAPAEVSIPAIDVTKRVFSHLAYAGLLVEATGQGWAGQGKFVTSSTTSLTGIVGTGRAFELNSDVPNLAALKVDTRGALTPTVGLYIPWVGAEIPDIDDLPLSGSKILYNLTRGVRNASALLEGDLALPNINAEGFVESHDTSRRAMAAFGGVSVQGTLEVYGDLYTTRFSADNLISGTRVHSGLIGHMNPVAAPRAQNRMYNVGRMSDYWVEIVSVGAVSNYESVLQMIETVPNEFNRVLNIAPARPDSELIPAAGARRYNRNPSGITQQQLGERATSIRFNLNVTPAQDVIYHSGANPGFDENTVVTTPTLAKVVAAGTQADYTLLFIGYHFPGTGVPATSGHEGEYIVFGFSRPLALWGDAYLGRTVTLQLRAQASKNIYTGVLTGVIIDIQDSPMSGLTFVAIAPIANRFDTWQSFVSGGQTTYVAPETFASPQLEELRAAGAVSDIDNSVTWEEQFFTDNSIGIRPTNTTLADNVQQINLDMRVQGREWVLNAYQAFISDKLFVCNDVGDSAEISLSRTGKLKISAPAVELSPGDGLLRGPNNWSIPFTEIASYVDIERRMPTVYTFYIRLNYLGTPLSESRAEVVQGVYINKNLPRPDLAFDYRDQNTTGIFVMSGSEVSRTFNSAAEAIRLFSRPVIIFPEPAPSDGDTFVAHLSAYALQQDNDLTTNPASPVQSVYNLTARRRHHQLTYPAAAARVANHVWIDETGTERTSYAVALSLEIPNTGYVDSNGSGLNLTVCYQLTLDTNGTFFQDTLDSGGTLG